MMTREAFARTPWVQRGLDREQGGRQPDASRGAVPAPGVGLMIGGPSYPMALVIRANRAYVCTFPAGPIGALDGT